MKQPLKGTWGQGRKHTKLPESLSTTSPLVPHSEDGEQGQCVIMQTYKYKHWATFFWHLLDKGEKEESAVPCYLLQKAEHYVPGSCVRGLITVLKTATVNISLHGALLSTYQAFKPDGRLYDSYAYTVKKINKKWTELKKKEEKSVYYHKLLKREKKKAMVIIICEFKYQILYQSSMHLFWRGKNVGEPKDAAFASRWGSAAMETDLDLSVIPYLPCCFYFHRLGRGQGIYFLSDMLIIFLFTLFIFFFSWFFSTVTCTSSS